MLIDYLLSVPHEYYKENLRHNKSVETKPNLRDKGNCWFIPYETRQTKLERGRHQATFPVRLVEDCLKLTGTTGTVLDPFMGTGTTAVAAVKLGWKYSGYEIDEEYVEFSKQRLNRPLDNFY